MTDDEIKRWLGAKLCEEGLFVQDSPTKSAFLDVEGLRAICNAALEARAELRACAAVAGHHANELRILLEEARAERDQAQKDAVMALGGFRVLADVRAAMLFDHDTKVRIDGYAARHSGYKPAPVGDGK